MKRTVDVPQLLFRADVGQFDEEERTVDIVFGTEVPILRYDWERGRKYWEVLSMQPNHVRLERLNSIGAVLDSHSAYSVGDVIGAVKRDSARVEKGKGLATLRLSRREDVNPIWQDIKDGILRSFSVGAAVFTFLEDQAKDGITRMTAVDWEPREISIVPVPADAGATARSADIFPKNSCVIESLPCDADRLRRLRLARAT